MACSNDDIDKLCKLKIEDAKNDTPLMTKLKYLIPYENTVTPA